MTDDPASIGQHVNLAALAAHELTTPGSPRAVAAATAKEMRSESGKPMGSGVDDASARTSRPKMNEASPVAPESRVVRAGAASPEIPGAIPEAAAPARVAQSTQSSAPTATTAPAPTAASVAGRESSLASLAAVGAGPAAVRGSDSAGGAGSSSMPVRGVIGLVGRSVSGVAVLKAPEPEPQPESPPENFAAQLKRGLAAVLRQQGGAVTVRLAPAALGQVRIRLELEQGEVSARFDVGGQQARQLLESDLDVLRRSLEARGLRVEDLSVTVRPELAGPKEAPAHDGGTPAREPPEQQDADSGGAGGQGPGAGAHHQESAPRPEAGVEPGRNAPTIDPWATVDGGAAQEVSTVLRLRFDAVA